MTIDNLLSGIIGALIASILTALFQNKLNKLSERRMSLIHYRNVLSDAITDFNANSEEAEALINNEIRAFRRVMHFFSKEAREGIVSYRINMRKIIDNKHKNDLEQDKRYFVFIENYTTIIKLVQKEIEGYSIIKQIQKLPCEERD